MMRHETFKSFNNYKTYSISLLLNNLAAGQLDSFSTLIALHLDSFSTLIV